MNAPFESMRHPLSQLGGQFLENAFDELPRTWRDALAEDRPARQAHELHARLEKFKHYKRFGPVADALKASAEVVSNAKR